MIQHDCASANTCLCWSGRLEPNDECPLHGQTGQPRCETCGKFLPWPKFQQISTALGQSTMKVPHD